MANEQTHLLFSVPSMHCGHCEAKVRVILESVPGISGADPDLSNGTVSVTLDPDNPASEEIIRAELKAGGYPAA
jgi:copper chaperone CopZ